MTLRLRIVFVLLALTASASALAASLQIPAGHPRLWFGNAQRLQQARDYFAAHPLDPGSDPYLRAARGVVAGNATDCPAAAAHLVGRQINSRDEFRWEGESLISIFDWCFQSLSPEQVTNLVERWNGYMDREIQLSEDRNLGEEGDEANNYWWGGTSNYLSWGIASHGVNSRAQEFIDFALDTRFGEWFPRWCGHFGKGGVFPEGSAYGVVNLSYGLVPFATARDFGLDPYAQTPYFREAIYALLYGTTPGPTTTTSGAAGAYSLFPFNDDELFHDGAVLGNRTYLGNFARYFSTRNATANAGHASAWFERTGTPSDWMFRALGNAGAGADIAGLPLDYYAPGAQVLDARTSHGADATQLHLQLGTPGGTGHRHLDAGSFQLWRKGRWLTRESTGYSDRLVAYGQPSGSTVTIDSSEEPAHNTLLVQRRTTGTWVGEHTPRFIPPGGSSNMDDPLDLPQVRRLQHAADFAYVATDYSGAYRHHVDTRVDWPYADKVWREFLFVRPLQAVVVLDRVRTSSDSLRPFYRGGGWVWDGPHVAAQDVERSFVYHFETQPTIAANRVTARVGTQTSELTTLLPRNPAYRIVNEGTPGDEQAGQYRIELDDSGSTESYFLHVATGYDDGEQRVATQLVEQGNQLRVTITHPQRGSATIVFEKGMASQGGSIALGSGAPMPLNDYVQGIHVDDDGPHWDGEGGDSIFTNGFESP
ncbi:hypothetical protein [Dokdonella sp.]|uniref:hypothetical protein n=1 Tax=Dokdonella sp. TaxID=2291710 RepID=UPI003784C1CC